MKLVGKSSVFLSSAEKTNGTTGEFTIQMPYDYQFDPKLVYKIWISQINMRNTFPWISFRNSRVFCHARQVTDPGPGQAGYPPFPDAGGLPQDWLAIDLPYGCPNNSEVAQAMDEAFQQLPINNIRVAVRYGKLFIFHSGAADAGPVAFNVDFYFSGTQAVGPCHLALGFPMTGVYTLVAERISRQATAARFLPYSNGVDITALPYPTSSSVQLMDCNHLSNLVIRTDLPSENYQISRDGPVNNGITVNVPIVVPPSGAILWQDTAGTNALLEKGRSVVNSLAVRVQTKDGVQLNPDHDWSMIINIETYEDVEAQVIKALTESNTDNEQMIQLLKMLLLQNELKHK